MWKFPANHIFPEGVLVDIDGPPKDILSVAEKNPKPGLNKLLVVLPELFKAIIPTLVFLEAVNEFCPNKNTLFELSTVLIILLALI